MQLWTSAGWDSKLDALTDLKVAQRTPLRVAHRRTGLVREKVIHSMSSELVSSRIFILDMDTSAGTYVKEFVHGDLGATETLVAQTLLRGVSQSFRTQLNEMRVHRKNLSERRVSARRAR